MKGIKKTYILAVCTCSIFLSCSPVTSPQDQLTPITTQGLETFSCEVSGKVWLPKFGLSIVGPIYPSLYFTPQWGDSSVSILVRNDYSKTSFIINFLHGNHIGNINDSDVTFSYSSNNSVFTNSHHRVDLQLLRADWGGKDTVIISGIFGGTLFNANGDTVSIQKGRFDLSTEPVK